MAGLALAMPIVSIGGCLKYSYLNEASSHEFVLFNGSDQPMNIVFDGKSIQLASQQIVRRELFSDKINLTDPVNGLVTEMVFPAGLSIVAYGDVFKLKVEELEYERLSFSNGNSGGSASASSRSVRNEIFSMRGDFFISMPGQKPPQTISRPKHSTTRYLSLSVEGPDAQPEEPRTEEEIMREAVQSAIEKTMESK